jgi:hypothetical protein
LEKHYFWRKFLIVLLLARSGYIITVYLFQYKNKSGAKQSNNKLNQVGLSTSGLSGFSRPGLFFAVYLAIFRRDPFLKMLKKKA